ncbi:sensor histidine kinase [Neomoorella carbonis]|uniref:sensor histidine kinase n=1 Tax=Neomoorella carbonis TaxID=3062783 RepID=UPI00325607C0
MISKHPFHLQNVVDTRVLQEIQDRFSEATGLAAIIVDYQGKPIVRYSNFSAFCARVRQDPMSRSRCEQTDAHAGLEAVRRGRPFIYRCHMGLVDVSAPIVVNGQYLGGIMTGQVRMEKKDMDSLEQFMQPAIDIDQDPTLKRLYESIAIIPRHKVEASAQLLYVMANYIAEKGVMTIIQEQLNEKNMRLMEEIKARAELEKALKDAELKALQSQINPHFLFNTLNAVSRLALLENAPKTQEIVFALAELLRGTVRKIGQVATLREELTYIKHYLLIIQTRLRDTIQVELNIDEDCLDGEIPLFTLQPLVENAIVHGLERKEEGGRLTIRILRNEETVRVEIEDNGLGMPPKVLEEVLQLESKRSDRTHLTGLGMNSVYKRLQYHFGSEFHWNVESRLDEGTKIILVFPYRAKEMK